jgi:hypothetical protein
MASVPHVAQLCYARKIIPDINKASFCKPDTEV